LALKPNQVYERIDFFHGVEHLGKVAALRKSSSSKERKRWVRRHRTLFLRGQLEMVVAAVREICRGRGRSQIRTRRNYFVKNLARMRYDCIRALRLPMGSGCVESAIRRVVNLRLRGPCIFNCAKPTQLLIA
jgi:hypothetical protein